MKGTRIWKRALSLTLALIMVIGVLPTGILAAEVTDPATAVAGDTYTVKGNNTKPAVTITGTHWEGPVKVEIADGAKGVCDKIEHTHSDTCYQECSHACGRECWYGLSCKHTCNDSCFGLGEGCPTRQGSYSLDSGYTYTYYEHSHTEPACYSYTWTLAWDVLNVNVTFLNNSVGVTAIDVPNTVEYNKSLTFKISATGDTKNTWKATINGQPVELSATEPTTVTVNNVTDGSIEIPLANEVKTYSISVIEQNKTGDCDYTIDKWENLVEGAEVPLAVSVPANSTSAKYNPVVTVSGEGASYENGKVIVGSADVTVTINYNANVLTGNTSAIIDYEPTLALAQLKERIFNAVITGSVPSGVTVDDVSIQYYPYRETNNLSVGSGFNAGLKNLGERAPDDNLDGLYHIYYDFGERFLAGSSTKEKVRIIWGSLYWEADITLQDARQDVTVTYNTSTVDALMNGFYSAAEQKDTLRADIVAAVVTSDGGHDGNVKVTVEDTGNINGWFPLSDFTETAANLGKPFGVGQTKNIRITWSGSTTYKDKTIEASIKLVESRPSTVINLENVEVEDGENTKNVQAVVFAETRDDVTDVVIEAALKNPTANKSAVIEATRKSRDASGSIVTTTDTTTVSFDNVTITLPEEWEFPTEGAYVDVSVAVSLVETKDYCGANDVTATVRIANPDYPSKITTELTNCTADIYQMNGEEKVPVNNLTAVDVGTYYVSIQASEGYTLDTASVMITDSHNNEVTKNPVTTGVYSFDVSRSDVKNPQLTYTITATSTVNRYTVTWDANGGHWMQEDGVTPFYEQSAKYDYNEGIDQPTTAPVKTGYVFNGWEGFTVNTTMGADDVTYKAQWEAEEYAITYNLNGGTVAAANPAQYTIESDAITLNNPTKTGYTFAGWTGTGLAAATKNVTITKGSTGNRTYTATWTPVEYTISYNLAEGTMPEGATNPETYTIESADFTLNNPTRTGYTFAGWTGTGLTSATKDVTIDSGSTGDRSYTANWQANTYTVTLNPGEGATVNPASVMVTYGQVYGELPQPVKEGYFFSGWQLINAENNSILITKDTVVSIAEDHTLQTVWSNKETYKIEYALNGGVYTEGQSNPEEYTIENEITLHKPTRTGYDFAGWTGTGLNEASAEVTIAKGSTGNRTYTATWTPVTYSVAYDLAGGALAEGASNAATYTIESDDFMLLNPTWAHYTFAGWTGTGLNEASTEVTVAKGSTGNRSYTATWAPVSYDITYDLAGGTLGTGVTNPAAYTIESDSFTLTNPTREGYTFAGWTGTDLAAATENVTITTGSVGVRSYIASWRINKYAVNWDADGGKFANNNEILTVDTEYGKAITIPAEKPTKEGHTFVSWNGFTEGTLMPAETVTYKAVWETNSYTVTWNVDNVKTTSSFAFGTVIELPTAPKKDNFIFTGWTGYTNGMTMPADNVEFTATWKADNNNNGVADEEETATITINVQGNGSVELTAPEDTKIVITPDGDGKYKIVYDSTDADNGKKYIITATPADRNGADGAAGYVVSVKQNGTAVEASYNETVLIATATLAGNDTIAAEFGMLTVVAKNHTVPVNGWLGELKLNYSGRLNDYKAGLTWQNFLNRSTTNVIANGNYEVEIAATVALDGWRSVSSLNEASTSILDLNSRPVRIIWKPADTDRYPTITSNSATATFQETRWSMTIDAPDAITLVKEADSDNMKQEVLNALASAGAQIKLSRGDNTSSVMAIPLTAFELPAYTFPSEGQQVSFDIILTYPEDQNYLGASAKTVSVTIQNPAYDAKVNIAVTNCTVEVYKNLENGVLSEQVEDPSQLAGGTYYFKVVPDKGYTVGASGVAFVSNVEDETEVFNFDKDNNVYVGTILVSELETPRRTYAITAKAFAAKFTVTWNADGGKWTDGNTAKTEDVTFGAKIEAPAENPTKTGYTFKEWSPKVEGTMGAANVEYIATWTKIPYTITYNLDGGVLPEGVTNPTEYDVESAAITLTNPTKLGYTFTGWRDAEGTVATKVTIAKGSIDVRTYTATWTKIPYTITYNLDGGVLPEGVTNPTEYDVESAAITLTNPTKVGYTFLGWTGTGLDGMVETVTIATSSTGNRVYTANWQAETYTITLNPGVGATVNGKESDTMTVTYGLAYGTLPAPVLLGYNFLGWYLGEDAVNAETIVSATADHMLTAMWSDAEAYDITYNLNDGSVTGNPDKYTVKTETFTLKNPTKTGYTFTGWTGTDLNEASTEVIVAKGSTGDRTYTATWSINSYDVTWGATGGAWANGASSRTEKMQYGASIAAPAESPAKIGYIFAGWQDLANGATVPAKNVIYPAMWTPVTYTISYDLDGGTMPEGATNPGTYTIERADFTLTNPTKLGYTFTGWRDAEGTVATKVTIAKGSIGDRTYTATWKLCSYDVVWDANGGAWGNVSEQIVQTPYGNIIQKYAVEPDRIGYIFKGWEGYADETTMPAQTVTYKAIWEAKRYTVTWHANGGKLNAGEETNTVSYAYGDEIYPQSEPTKDKAVFTGWEGFVANMTMPDKNVTFTAQWAPDVNSNNVDDHQETATITVVANGSGSGSVELSAPGKTVITGSGNTYTVVFDSKDNASKVVTTVGKAKDTDGSDGTADYVQSVVPASVTVDVGGSYDVVAVFEKATFALPNETGLITINGALLEILKKLDGLKDKVLKAAFGEQQYAGGDYTVYMVTGAGTFDVETDDVIQKSIMAGALNVGDTQTFVVERKVAVPIPALSDSINISVVDSRSKPTIVYKGANTIAFDTIDELKTAVLAGIEISPSDARDNLELSVIGTKPAVDKDGENQSIRYKAEVKEGSTWIGASIEFTITAVGKVHEARISVTENAEHGTVTLKDKAGMDVGSTHGTDTLTLTVDPDGAWYVKSVSLTHNNGQPTVLTGKYDAQTFEASFDVSNGDYGADSEYIVHVEYAERKILVNEQITALQYNPKNTTDAQQAELLSNVYKSIVSGSEPVGDDRITYEQCTVALKNGGKPVIGDNVFVVTWNATDVYPEVSVEKTVTLSESRVAALITATIPEEVQLVDGDISGIATLVKAEASEGANAPEVKLVENQTAPLQGENKNIAVIITVAENDRYLASSKTVQVPVVGKVHPAAITVETAGDANAVVSAIHKCDGVETTVVSGDAYLSGTLTVTAKPSGFYYVDKIEVFENGSTTGTVLAVSNEGTTCAANFVTDDGEGESHNADTKSYRVVVTFAERGFTLKSEPTISINRGSKVSEQFEQVKKDIIDATVETVPVPLADVDKHTATVQFYMSIDRSIDIGGYSVPIKLDGWYGLDESLMDHIDLGGLGGILGSVLPKLYIADLAFDDGSEQIRVVYGETGKYPTVYKETMLKVGDSRPVPMITCEDFAIDFDKASEVKDAVAAKATAVYGLENTPITITVDMIEGGGSLPENKDGESQEVTYFITIPATELYQSATKTVNVVATGIVHQSTIVINTVENAAVQVLNSEKQTVVSGSESPAGTYTVVVDPAENGYYVSGVTVTMTCNGKTTDVALSEVIFDQQTGTATFTVTNGDFEKEQTYTVSATTGQRVLTVASETVPIQLMDNWTTEEILDAVYIATVMSGPVSQSECELTYEGELVLGEKTFQITWKGDAQYPTLTKSVKVLFTNKAEKALISKAKNIPVLEVDNGNIDGVAAYLQKLESDAATQTLTFIPADARANASYTLKEDQTGPRSGETKDIYVIVSVEAGNSTSGAAWLENAVEIPVPVKGKELPCELVVENDGTKGTYFLAQEKPDEQYMGEMITITASPAVGYYVDGLAITVDGTTETVDVNDTWENFTYTGKFPVGYNHKYEVTILYKESKFVLDPEGVLDFCYGITEPNDQDVYNAVIDNPDDYSAEKISQIKYLARPAGTTVDVELPEWLVSAAQAAGFGDRIPAVISIPLDEMWLPINAEVEPVDLDATVKDITNSLFDGIDITNVLDWLDAVDRLKNLADEVQDALKFYNCHEFGYNLSGSEDVQEKLIIEYQDQQKYIYDDTIIITLRDLRTSTTLSGSPATVVYNAYTNADVLSLIAPKVLVNGAEVAVESNLLKLIDDTEGLDAGTYDTITVRFLGNEALKPCEAEFKLVVNKAPSSIDYDSQVIRWSEAQDYQFELVKNPANLKTLDFMVGLDLENDLEGYVQIVLPSLEIFGLEIKLPEGDYTLSELKNLLGNYSEQIPGLNSLIQILEELQSQISLGELYIKLGGEMKPKNIGVYLAGAVSVDPNYETSYTVDYLIVTPDGTKTELEWNVHDENGIITLEALREYDMGASAYLEGETEVCQPATDLIHHLVLWVDLDGEFHIQRMTQDEVNNLSDVGAYSQVAYVQDWGNTMYYSIPIVRVFVVVPETVSVEFVENPVVKSYVPGQSYGMDVTVDGVPMEPNENLTLTYIGLDTTNGYYNSTTEPSLTGTYAVLATYLEKDANDHPTKVGVAVGSLTILPSTESTVDVVNKTHTYDGNPVDVMTMITATPENVGLTVITAGVELNGSPIENGWDVVNGTINIDFPDNVDRLLQKYMADAYENGIGMEDFIVLFENLKDPMADMGIEEEKMQKVISFLQGLPKDAILTFKSVDEVAPRDMGVHLVGAIILDPNYLPKIDAGLLTIVPDVYEAELQWTMELPYNVVSLPDLQAGTVDLSAKALVDGTEDAALSEKIGYLYLVVDEDGVELTVWPGEWKLGMMTEVAYLVDVDNTMPAPTAIMRMLLVAPETANVAVTGGTYTYDGQPKAVEVTVDGVSMAPGGNLTVRYIGLNTAEYTYNSTTPPTAIGAYAVLATYLEKDADDNLIRMGMDVGSLIIEPVNAAFQLKDVEAEYDGEEHFVEIINPEDLHYIAVVTSETENGKTDLNILISNSSTSETVDVGSYVDLAETALPLVKDMLPEEILNNSTLSGLVDKLLEEVGKIVEKVDVGEFAINGALPTEVGTYQVQALGYASNTMPVYSSATLTIMPVVKPVVPVIDPNGGEYKTGEQIAVTITTTEPDAVIYYTVDGTDPTVSEQNRYNGSFVVETSLVIKAIAEKDGKISDVVSAVFTFTDLDKTPVPTIHSLYYEFVYGKDNNPIVQIDPPKSAAEAVIYYTTDGTDPTVSETRQVYQEPFEATTTMLVRAIAIAENLAPSAVVEKQYTMTVAAPAIWPYAGEFTEETTNVFFYKWADEEIYFTTDGSDPVVGVSPLYDLSVYPYGVPISTKDTTVKAIAVKNGIVSKIAGVEYTYVGGTTTETVADPVIASVTGNTSFTDMLEVQITCKTGGSKIYYTTDGKDPVEFGKEYRGTFEITETTTVKAIAVKGSVTSIVVSATFDKQEAPKPATVADPVIASVTGETTFADTLMVQITCATEDATIHYTTDGSEPAESSAVYATAFEIDATTTVKAIAVKDGIRCANVAVKTFTKQVEEVTVAAPVISPNGGIFTDSVTVEITCETEKATVWYTINGGEPQVYTGPITLTETATVVAWSVKGDVTSATVSAIFTKKSVTEPEVTVAAPVIRPDSCTFTDSMTVTITAESDATIWYTINGSEPQVYTGSITLTETATVVAWAAKDGVISEQVSSTFTKKAEPKPDTPVIPDVPRPEPGWKYEHSHSCVCNGVDCVCERFVDVRGTDWFAEDVCGVYHMGLMNGVGFRRFDPNGSTTRGMIVTILWRLEGSPELEGDSKFKDVASRKYYAEAIQWANVNGIVLGYDEKTFGPNDPITREQMAAILYRYAGFKGYDVEARADLSGYVDNSDVSEYAAEAMAWANAEGLINGLPGSLLDPRGGAIRAQVAAILNRFCKFIIP